MLGFFGAVLMYIGCVVLSYAFMDWTRSDNLTFKEEDVGLISLVADLLNRDIEEHLIALLWPVILVFNVLIAVGMLFHFVFSPPPLETPSIAR